MNTDFIPFHQPTIGDDEIRSVVETLKSGWLTTGHKVKTFEEDFARYVGAKSCGSGEFRHSSSSSGVRCDRNHRGR